MMANFAIMLFRGAILTIELTAAASIGAFLLAVLAGLLRARGGFGGVVAAVYIEFFRGTSLLVQLFWIFFVLPLFGFSISPFLAGFLGLSLNFGAYGAEIVRSSVLSVPASQLEAADALNLSRLQRLRLVVIPQALPLAVPAFSNLSIELLKGTSLVSILGLSELMFTAYQLNMATLKTLPILSLLAVYYLILTGALTALFRVAERRVSAYRLTRR